MPTCKDIIDLLSDYLDGALTAGALEDFEAHIALCAACVQYLESLRETQARVRDLRCDDLPQEVHRALRAFLDRATKGRRS